MSSVGRFTRQMWDGSFEVAIMVVTISSPLVGSGKPVVVHKEMGRGGVFRESSKTER